MHALKSLHLALGIVSGAAAQQPEPPLSDSPLTVHTLVREDTFARFLANDIGRFARAERNIDLLTQQRPGDGGNLMAWKGSAALHRAVLAHEAG